MSTCGKKVVHTGPLLKRRKSGKRESAMREIGRNTDESDGSVLGGMTTMGTISAGA
jgi:hypothetical protein